MKPGWHKGLSLSRTYLLNASINAATGAAVAGALQTVNRLIITVDNGGWATLAAEALKELEILGQLQAIIGVADGGTIVTISWGFK